MKKYFTVIFSLLLIIISCEKDELENKNISITIISPENESQIICEDCTIKIMAVIENKEEAEIAYIVVDEQIIKSGLSDTIIAYYNPPDLNNQTITIKARLNIENIKDEITVDINSTDTETNPLNFNPILMDVNNQFKMMRFPVTNREFINFLNNNEFVEVELAEILWNDIDLNLKLPIKKPLISKKDKLNISLKQFLKKYKHL